MAKIKVENTEISVLNVQNEDYISLTDMAHSKMQEHIIFILMSLKRTIEYLGEWEMLYNPNFNCTEFDKEMFIGKELSPCENVDKHLPSLLFGQERCRK